MFDHFCCDRPQLSTLQYVGDTMREARRPHSIETSHNNGNLEHCAPRGCAKPGQNHSRLRWAAACRHTDQFGSRRRKLDVRSCRHLSHACIQAVTDTCATLALANFEPADRTTTTVRCSVRPAQVFEGNLVILTPFQ
jgi:hypothetical protein